MWSALGEGAHAGVRAEGVKTGEETMKKSIISHAASGCAAALLASFLTWLALAPGSMSLLEAHAQTPPAYTAARQTELFKTTMNDGLGREVTIRRLERNTRTGTGPHPHPGRHTFGYVRQARSHLIFRNLPLHNTLTACNSPSPPH